MKAGLVFISLLLSTVSAAEEIQICYNYDCAARVTVQIDDSALQRISAFFGAVSDSASERSAIAAAVGELETIAGQQSPTRADRGGNYDDDGVNGRMDCLDESHNTTRYLEFLARHDWVRFHRVLERQKRATLLIFDHWSAAIEEGKTGQRYAVDSWFDDNGKPATILKLEDWLSGAGPETAALVSTLE